MKEKKPPLLFRFIRKAVRIFYPRYEVIFFDLEYEPGNILVGNHSGMHSPLANYFDYPYPKKIWVIGEMTNIKEVPAYAFEDFWRHKKWYIRWFYKLLSYIIAPLSVYLMKHADTIAVYKDLRISRTFKETFKSLENNEDVIIFPEHRVEYNHIINDFQINYIEVARMYYKRTNQKLKFYPVYYSRSLKKMVVGLPITYNPENDRTLEKERINNYLKEEITKMALELPRHKVIPYTNGAPRVYSKDK